MGYELDDHPSSMVDDGSPPDGTLQSDHSQFDWPSVVAIAAIPIPGMMTTQEGTPKWTDPMHSEDRLP